MDDIRFETLERLNAQIDVWIDQEEFDLIVASFKCLPTEKDTSFGNRLENAFSNDSCTFLLEKEWDELLNVTSPLLVEFRFPDKDWTLFVNDKDNRELEDKWAQFFWAKLIRARIQQKGSDCYFNRLDQLIVFLERNQPVIKRNFDQTNKLAVIYLLEMAASGLGADQESFADRARRVLKEHFKEKDCFHYFYNLLARYNIALGFQHEGRNRDAVREFNWIIKKLGDFWTKQGDVSQEKLANYVEKRCGLDFLYLPAVLGRASIEIKLQLAYHSLETFENFWKRFRVKDDYLSAKKELMSAEANRLMGDCKMSEKNLRKVAKLLIGKCQINSSPAGELPTKWIDRFEQINKVCRPKWANINGRLLDTYVALHLDKLKDKLEERSALKESLEQISKILSMYWEASKWQTTNRTGYLELVAAYLGWIAKEIKNIDPADANNVKSIAVELYKENKEYLIPEKQDDGDRKNQHTCPACTQLVIKLERLGSSHYQEFVKNMQEFYSKFKRDFDLDEDSINFRKRIFDVERDHREDSAYQKREMAMNHLGDGDEFVPPEWCIKCIGKEINPRRAFSGLLECVSKEGNNNQSKPEQALSLDSNHYEHLMDQWAKRFLNHLEIESVHLPRCKALHLIGLQRWNSTSPAIGRSLGGGYLIYHTNGKGQVDLGVAVDPGFDFVRNLFHLGFSLSDIDVVLLSHAHLDHIRDFESLVTLCLELNKRHPDKVKRRLHTIMTLGVYRRLPHIFASPGLREFVEPYILDIKKEIEPKFVEPYIDKLEYYDPYLKPNENNPKPKSNSDRKGFVFQENPDSKKGSNTNHVHFRFLAETSSKSENKDGLRLSITATRAYHEDFSEYSDSFGFKVNVSAGGCTGTTIGYTGDTSWSPDIIEQYKKCDALIVHIGSLIDRGKRFDDYEKNGKECWKLIKKNNHPYLFGLLRFLTEIAGSTFTEKVPLVLLSEFGEELRGRIRLDLYKRLSDHYNGKDALRKIPLLPLDVGLDIILSLDEPKNEPKDKNPNPPKGKIDCTRLGKLLKENGPPVLVNCVICEDFVIQQQVDFETYGHDEALYCVCKACRRSTPQNVLQDKLRDLYDVARPLQSY